LTTLDYFWIFLKASLFSTGGTGNLPLLHADLLARHAATDQQFAEALAIGQLSPGPTGLWVIGLGYLTRGIAGSLLALVAIVLPPLSILVIRLGYRRVHDHPAVEGFMRGLTLAVCGISTVVLMTVLRSAGLSRMSIATMLASVALVATKKVPIPLIFTVASIAGIAIYGR